MLNKVFLIGRLGRDPEFRTTAQSIPLAKFTMATDERRRGENGELQTTTEWHRVVLWRRQAEVARDYLRKGSLIHLEGKIHYDSYENKEGQKVWTTEIIGDRFQMLDTKGEAGSAPPSEGGRWEQAVPAPSGGDQAIDQANDEDLPF
jgi:single-strand DNA-binding protein